MGPFEWDDADELDRHYASPEETEDDTDFEDDDTDIYRRLWLPSTFGHDFCSNNGWALFVEQEIQLQIAQAEESLEELRLAIGHKSILYKLRIRKYKSQASKTRNHAELLQINSKMKGLATRYRCARAALQSLGVSETILHKFQQLADNDLHVNTDISEENRVGQRNDTLSWFWRIGGTSTDNPWMNESKYQNFLTFLTSLHTYKCSIEGELAQSQSSM